MGISYCTALVALWGDILYFLICICALLKITNKKSKLKEPSGKPLLVFHDLICKTETVAKAISLQYILYIWDMPLAYRLTRSDGSCSVIVLWPRHLQKPPHKQYP